MNNDKKKAVEIWKKWMQSKYESYYKAKDNSSKKPKSSGMNMR